jgi:hypothetical protein
MIASGALSAISWPLLLGKIPAMLFTHIFAAKASHWIWGVNTFLFLVCGIGLLKLQRWSYPATIALHVFWLVSLFVSQISPLYNRYISLCLSTLSAPNSYISLGMNRFPQWVSAILTAIPTALLIAGLFYYRRKCSCPENAAFSRTLASFFFILQINILIAMAGPLAASLAVSLCYAFCLGEFHPEWPLPLIYLCRKPGAKSLTAP